MKFKTAAGLMFALALGLITAYVGVDVVNKAKKGAQAATKVVVAARDMEPGYVIEPSDLKLEDVPVSLVPAKAFKDAKLVTGRTVLASVVRGYPLIDNQLAAPGTGAGMQAMVPKGMRAVAVEVSEGSAVAGLITPGCFVDVLATFNNREQTVATTVVQNVKVQFVKRSRPPRSSNANSAAAAAAAGSPDQLGDVKSVTLIVTPRQAAHIELANNQGKPRLILRGGEDDSDMADTTVRQNELLGIPDPPPPATQPAPQPTAVVAAPPPPPPPAIEKVTDVFTDPPPMPVSNKRLVHMIRGGNESTIAFEENGDRSLKEEPSTPALASSSTGRRPKPTTRPQPPQPPKKSEKVNESETERETETEKDGVGGEPRTASGASPGEPALRADQVKGELRRGM